MRTLLAHADVVVTMDDERREIRDGGVLIDGRSLAAVGPTAELPDDADRTIDCRGMVLLPGLVNTHHHLYQTLTRALPGAQDADLFGWLRTLYPVWGALRADDVYVSAKLGLAEMLLSGCTTTSDHLYLFPNDVAIEDEIRAAREVGVRFHATRGSMSLGESRGGLPPDYLVEDDDAIMRDTQRAVETHHDAERFAMLRVAVAPCSPFSVTPDLMRASVALADDLGVHCHTHLAETLDEERFCIEQFGVRPVEYAERLGWLRPDVWFAHSVWIDDDEIARLAAAGTGVAHCPTSNMRLASGVAPVVRMLAAGMRVGLGVDGSASNDGEHVLGEARAFMLLQRVGTRDPGAVTARTALEVATRGGARVLGRDDVGVLAPGLAADVVGWRLDRAAYSGARADPVAALVFCQPQDVDLALVDGVERVRAGEIVDLDLGALVAEHGRRACDLLRRSENS
ncbi:MAG TPA: 8-oxoguanine deaminase [Actinomycetota bacterium]|nr:8-oxoguanine deaminase [Actinomycetota bacterium]